MSAAPQLTPSTPRTGTGTGSATGKAPATGPDSKDRINNAYSLTFAIPPGIKLDQFDGSNWPEWSGIIELILILQEADDLLSLKVGPSNIGSVEWASIQKRSKAYLHLYIKPDIYSLIASDIEPVMKMKIHDAPMKDERCYLVAAVLSTCLLYDT